MDPEGNYESRLSYTTKSSRDIYVDGGDPLSEAPAGDPTNGLSASEHKYEEKERACDYFGASAPPLPGVSLHVSAENTCSPSPPEAAEEDGRKPSPVTNREETKGLSPPGEPALNTSSVVVPIGPGAIDTLPVALPIVMNATGGGLDATILLPESPDTGQPSSDEFPAAEKETGTQKKMCSAKKMLLLFIVVILVAGLAATLTILLWPNQRPDEQQEDPYVYNSNDDEETMEPSPTEEPTEESTTEITSVIRIKC